MCGAMYFRGQIDNTDGERVAQLMRTNQQILDKLSEAYRYAMQLDIQQYEIIEQRTFL